MTSQPLQKPQNPNFSSGPCAKRPGWTLDALKGALVGRSHRSSEGKAKLAKAISQTIEILGIPEGYRVGIVPASDTGAVEMSLWSLLGERPVDVFAWEAFSKDWVTDITKQLKLNARTFSAPYGEIADLSAANFDHDVVFAWNGTTSGVRVPDASWIPADRTGLTICDATSAVFAQDLDWSKLDVVTFSWQKVMGGEGAHGMLILSPRAVARLESFTPDRPLPKIFRMTKGGKLNEGIFKGETINTPSMICVEDYLDALNWAQSIGGLPALQKRVQQNADALTAWVSQTPWVDFLASTDAIRSNTSVCLKIVDPAFTALTEDEQAAVCKKMASLLDKQGIAHDIGGYRDAPAGLRIWCGATVEASDIALLGPWLEWAWSQAKPQAAAA